MSKQFYNNKRLYLPIVFILSQILLSCVGSSSTPVIYLSPDSTTDYNQTNFKPALEFPDGLPLQNEVEIRVNGVVVTSEFDDWGSAGTGSTNINVAEVTLNVSDANTPIIWSALRDGVNTFQVSDPLKDIVFFTFDLPSAEVHFSNVIDGYDGSSAKNGSPLHVEGFLEGKDYSTLLDMTVEVSRVDASGALNTLGLTGSKITAAPNNTVSDGLYYLQLNADYSFEFEVYDANSDADAVTITVTDTEGSASKTWLRPNIPLYDSRLANDGTFSARIKEKTVLSFTNFLAQAFTLNDGLGLTLLGPIDVLGFGNLTAVDESLGGADIDVTLPIPTVDGGPSGNPRGSLKVVLNLDDLWFKAYGDGLFGICAWTEISTDLYVDTNVTAIVNPSNYKVSSNLIINELQVNNLDIDMWDPNFFINLLCGIAGAIASPLAEALAPAVSGIVGGIVEGVVNGIFNNDLPLLRLVIQGQYMTLNPQMREISSSVDPWMIGNGPTQDDVGLDASLGFHTRGIGGRPNKSIGSLYVPNVLAPAINTQDQVNGTDEKYVGANIGENFINQLMMGLWESGILYIDFNAGTIPDNPFIDDALIQFASASPWEVDIKDQGTPEGNIKITIPDLLLGFRGDVYNPFTGAKDYDDYNFFNMVLNMNFYARVNSDLDSNAVVLTLSSTPEIEVVDVSTAVFPVTNAQAQTLLDYALTFLTIELGTLAIELPEIIGLTVNIGDVWTTDTSLAITLDAFDVDAFPPGTFGSTFDFQNATYNVSEADGTATVTVLRQNTSSPASITLSSSNGAAIAGNDYGALSTTVSFAAGESSKAVDVTILDDALLECPGSENINFALSNPSGYGILGSLINATVWIADDDGVGAGTGTAGTHKESFESGFGIWSNTGTAAYQRDTGGTPSGSTGPSDGWDGPTYIYAETSSGGSDESFILNTKYFDELALVLFDYHMYGSNMGTVSLQWKGPCGVWTTIWSESGNQGDQWESATVDFRGLQGVTEVRFYYDGGSGYRADFALDDIWVVSN